MQKFTQTKRGKVMLVIWQLIVAWAILFNCSYSTANSEFQEYKKEQQAIVEIITSITDDYDKYQFMSEEMVSHIEHNYCFYNTVSVDPFFEKIYDDLEKEAEEDREAVAKVMQTKGYSGYSEWDVQYALRYYSFAEYDGYDYFYGSIILGSVLAVTVILNAILVYFYKHPTQGSKNRTLKKLKKLDEMLGYGVISQTEYEQKKSILLATIQDTGSNDVE